MLFSSGGLSEYNQFASKDEESCRIPSDFKKDLKDIFGNLNTLPEKIKFLQEFHRLAKEYNELSEEDLYELRSAIKEGPFSTNGWKKEQESNKQTSSFVRKGCELLLKLMKLV